MSEPQHIPTQHGLIMPSSLDKLQTSSFIIHYEGRQFTGLRSFVLKGHDYSIGDVSQARTLTNSKRTHYHVSMVLEWPFPAIDWLQLKKRPQLHLQVRAGHGCIFWPNQTTNLRVGWNITSTNGVGKSRVCHTEEDVCHKGPRGAESCEIMP